MTANDIVSTAMRRINAIEAGETPDFGEAAAGLETLNDMIDGWQTERLMIPYMQRLYFDLTVLKQTYTCGTGGDFDIPRPARIERMGIVNLNNPNQPMELPLRMLTEAEWLVRWPVKNITSTLPQEVWVDDAFPWRNLNYWTIPAIPVGTTLYVWSTLQRFQDLATDYEFPPGYADAIKWNVALRFASEFGGFMPPQVPMMAQQSIAKIKALNTPSLDMRCDEALVATGKRQYNWLTDTPAGSR